MLWDKGCPRSISDDYNALDVDENISPPVYANVISALRSLMQNGGSSHASSPTSDVEKDLMITDWQEIAQKLEEIKRNPDCSKKIFGKMMTTAILPSVLCQYFTYPTEAHAWWTSICCNNTGTDTNAKAFYSYLNDIEKIRARDNSLFMENSCRFFNAHITGKPAHVAKNMKKSGSYILTIIGTPFGRKNGNNQNVLIYDLKRRGDYVNNGYETNVGCFRPDNSTYKETSLAEAKSLIKNSIESAAAITPGGDTGYSATA